MFVMFFECVKLVCCIFSLKFVLVCFNVSSCLGVIDWLVSVVFMVFIELLLKLSLFVIVDVVIVVILGILLVSVVMSYGVIVFRIFSIVIFLVCG